MLPRDLLNFNTMKRAALILFLALLALLAPTPLFAQGTLLDAQVRFEHVSYDSALVDKENYGGDLLIYFFQRESNNHQAVLSRALNHEKLTRYINEHFARIAIDTATPEGRDVLRLFRDDLPHWDFILVQYTEATKESEPVGRGMHGWGNIHDEGDVASWLGRLRRAKEREPLP